MTNEDMEVYEGEVADFGLDYEGDNYDEEDDYTKPRAIEREPVWTVAGIAGGIEAIVVLAVAFGLDISAEQTTAIMAVVLIVAQVAVAAITRSKVYAPASVDELADELVDDVGDDNSSDYIDDGSDEYVEAAEEDSTK